MVRNIVSVIVVVTVCIAGCSRLGEPAWIRDGSAPVWPSQDAPRIRYIGCIGSENDLRPGKPLWGVILFRNHAIELSDPKDIAVHGNRVYVTDPGLWGVVMFDLATRKTSYIEGIPGHPFAHPSHVAVSDDHLFVTDTIEQCVRVLDHDGIYRGTWGQGRLRRPGGLCWCPENDRLYVVDMADHCVVAFDRRGREVLRFGRHGRGAGEFNFPLWVRYDEKLGVLVSDSVNARIQRFTTDGRFVGAIAQAGSQAQRCALPQGFDVDNIGHIYVADGRENCIRVFDSEGQLLFSVGSEGDGPGQFRQPGGVFIDGENRLWVADTENERLEIFQLYP